MNFQTFTSFFFKKRETKGWGDDYKIYDFNVSEIRALAPLLKTPLCQTELNEERVESITISFHERPHFFEHKTTLVVAVLVSRQDVFLMDGQHRVEFIQRCLDIPPLTSVRIVAYNIRSEQEMRDLFQDLNHDSFKNQTYVTMGIDAQRMRDEVKSALEEKYNQWFPKNKKKNSRLRTSAAFVDELPADLFTKFNESRDIVQFIVAKNHKFLQKMGSVELYSEERDIVQKGQIVFPLIYCNFIEFLQTDEEVYYEGPRHRKSISQKNRLTIWANEFGEAETGNCPVCQKSLLSKVRPHGFECGHIISHKNKGTETVENLRPICAHCNQLMGTTNWSDFLAPKKKGWFTW